jgi:hypothetical protein
LVDQCEVEFITNVKINYNERNCGCTYILQNRIEKCPCVNILIAIIIPNQQLPLLEGSYVIEFVVYKPSRCLSYISAIKLHFLLHREQSVHFKI